MNRGKIVGLCLTALLVTSLVLTGFLGSGERAPPTITGITSKLNSSSFLHWEFELKNGSGIVLENVELTLVLVNEDGTKPGTRLSWPIWDIGETKKITIPANRFQKATLRGTANHGSKKYTVNNEWTWEWATPR